GIAGALGVVSTLLLLYLMHSLVNKEFIAPEDSEETKIADIQLQKREIETRFEDAKPEKPEEPDAPPPEIPEPEFDTPDAKLDGLNMETPGFDSEITMNIGGFSGDGE